MSFYDYAEELKSGYYKQKVKIELLRADESAYQTITSLLVNSSGGLNVQRNNGIRRTVDFTLYNDGEFIPNPDSFWIRQKFKLYLGIELSDGTDFWLSQGVFVFDDPSVASSFSKSTVNIRGVDKFGLISTIGGELDKTFVIPVGTDITMAFKTLLTDIVEDPQEPLIDSMLTGLVTPYTIEKETSSKVGDILVELAQMYSCSVYYDDNGRLRVERDTNDVIKQPLWDFTTDEFNYMGSTHTYKWSEMFNAVQVIGSNINGNISDYKAQNVNLSSSTSIPNVGFERVYMQEDENLDNDSKCQDLAEYILKRKTAVQSEITIKSIPMYHLKPDGVVTLTDNNLALDKERFIINSYSIDLQTGGGMNIKCVKATEIPFI